MVAVLHGVFGQGLHTAGMSHGPTDRLRRFHPEEETIPQQNLVALLRKTAEAAERLNLDFEDLYRALPSGGEAIALDVVARRLAVDLSDLAQRDVLVFGLSRHRDVLRLRPDVRGMRMFARRLGRPK